MLIRWERDWSSSTRLRAGMRSAEGGRPESLKLAAPESREIPQWVTALESAVSSKGDFQPDKVDNPGRPTIASGEGQAAL